LLRGQVFIWDDATDILGITGRLSFLNSSSVGYVTSTGNSYARIEGMLQTNAAGTFGLYWAQNTSGANNTSVSPGSNIVTMRIA
jgi:hypothetical protein